MGEKSQKGRREFRFPKDWKVKFRKLRKKAGVQTDGELLQVAVKKLEAAGHPAFKKTR